MHNFIWSFVRSPTEFSNFPMADNDVLFQVVIAALYYNNSKKKCMNRRLGEKTKLQFIKGKQVQRAV